MDLEKMRSVLTAGRKAANGTYYVHIGDLNWWTHYTYPGQELWEYIYLWESAQGDGQLEGWALLNPHFGTFDVFINPSLRGSEHAAKMYIWAEACAAGFALSQGGDHISTIWILSDDQVLDAHLKSRGFKRDAEYHVYMTRSLDEELLPVVLPQGYQVTDMHNDNNAEQRAAASYAAFQSRTPWERYLERYCRFRRSPVYKPEHDLVISAPGGRLASFCLIWLDEENRVGLFEPVGTHPEYQRLGLGKAIMLAGLQRMRAEGMQTAIVNTEHDNLGAQQLYQSVGFQKTNRLYAYTKQLENDSDRGQEHGI